MVCARVAVAGLLVFTVWVNGRGFSGAAGAAALTVLMLPTVTRTSEEILRTIPDNLREASLALGAFADGKPWEGSAAIPSSAPRWSTRAPRSRASCRRARW